MDRSFVEAVREGAGIVEPLDGGAVLAHEKWKEILLHVPAVAPIAVQTLSGLVSYIAAEPPPAKSFVHVASAIEVHLIGPLEGELTRFRRSCYAEAIAPKRAHKFGQFLDYEEFVVWIKSGFVKDVGSSYLLAFLGSIKDANVRETSDNGLAQTVSTRAGIEMSESSRVPNPITLAPFRTFAEVHQQPSSFVLRLRWAAGSSKPQAALFEADGGGWAVEAMSIVAEHLRVMLEGDGPTVVA